MDKKAAQTDNSELHMNVLDCPTLLVDTVTARCLLTNNSSNFSAAVMHRNCV